MRFRAAFCMLTLALTFFIHAEDAPTVDQLKAALNVRLQKLKPDWAKERTVLFQEVKAGRPDGPFFPFQFTATVHDYGTGFPKNKFYGQTTVGKIEQAKFDMKRDDFGGWAVEGPMTPGNSVSKNNPSEGVSAIPLSTLTGEQAPAPGVATPAVPNAAKQEGAALGAQIAQPQAPAANVNLYIGEWASYGTGGRLLIGLGFKLKADGTYTNLDGGEGGTYIYNAGTATIAFKGGFMDGQTGREVRSTGFRLSNTVSCEPYKTK